MRRARLLLAPILLLAALGARAGVDLNSADAETLARAVPGVGPARAEAIVRYRETHGPFRSLEDLLAVRGIGPKLLERMRGVVEVRPPEPQEAAAAR
ncbi:ComEA family DNA-binding protein [Inmirania thermothiophila]|uniref:Competence ComEA-like helix-hairpin-helix protein n=1 Tax=Inmirania thermothiophila TaxID=1750597 RepID=A0A3N1Y981_9GAMM|nr:helix-hairpin-helix domain-containing protein [Inmirania thermothiophila]ROR35101.1 competence ComEA-like helix-hairpin-helix protein [Inmirania thermothiophila]